MTPNAELAYKVLDHIDADPDSWDQARWIHKTDCGTAACFAGWTVLLAGGQIGGEPFFPSVTDAPDPELVDLHVSTAAARLLGLSGPLFHDPTLPLDREAEPSESDDLFDEENDREQLGHLVEKLFGPRPEPQP